MIDVMTSVSKRNYRGSVPVDATRTRELLLAAGARHFAERGIHGAQMREVVRAAGQANDSAVHYHFGSRDGPARGDLHPAPRRDGARAACAGWPARTRIPTCVPCSPISSPRPRPRLATQDGRYFLRITAQLASQAGVRSGTPPALIGDALRVQLEQVRALCSTSMSPELAGERIAIVVGALTAALADRAVAIDEHASSTSTTNSSSTNLVTMLAAALQS